MKNVHRINEKIYITSDEEIKFNDYITDGQIQSLSCSLSGKKKIILTTDPDLIKDGVQAIDDEFLEWFVNNPSCESVETKLVEFEVDMGLGDSCIEYGSYYKIIIPKQEPKQEQKQHLIDMMKGDEELGLYKEPIQVFDKSKYISGIDPYDKQENTLEEAAENYSLELLEANTIRSHEKTWIKSMFIHIAKWQQERMYSEEEVQVKLYECLGHFAQKHNIIIKGSEIDQWFENLKKKTQ